MGDPLSKFWVHDITIERALDDTSEGDAWADPETVKGFWVDGTSRNPEQLLVSQSSVYFPWTVAPIPVGSRITYGDKAGQVIVSSDHEGIPRISPKHRAVTLNG